MIRDCYFEDEALVGYSRFMSVWKQVGQSLSTGEACGQEYVSEPMEIMKDSRGKIEQNKPTQQQTRIQ